MMTYRKKDLLYENSLSKPEDIEDFKLEGKANITFEEGVMQIQNALPPSEDGQQQQKANIVFWCPQEFPDRISIEWKFRPIQEPGLAILFFAAKGRNGEDLFDPKLNERTGPYSQYHHGDINALHISYFRRRYASERAFHLCNLRKSYGFHMVAQGADPIPPVADCSQEPYELKLIKYDSDVSFYINDFPILSWHDDGEQFGEVLGGGKIGFRQMSPLIAQYSDLKIHSLEVSE